MPSDMTPDPAVDHDALVTALRAWDGRTVADVAALHATHQDRAGFLSALVEACADAKTEMAATWLIKHHCETGHEEVAEALRARLYKQLPRLKHWASQLHLLQLVDDLPIPASAAPSVFEAVLAGATSSKTLLKAWSLYGAAQLARQHPQYDRKVRSLLDKAANDDPKGAVAVRLRKASALMKTQSKLEKP